MVPAFVENGEFHTLVTSGFVHSPGDALHVLGNIIIIALVGIPLEERLGRNKWLISYTIGLLGGSIAWTIANSGSYTPALGASGAAFGILGAYLCGWPRDEVFFPFILIRKWPVQFIALIYFGLEIVRAYQVYEFSEISHVAHIAHLGGFIAAYAFLPILKKGIEWEEEAELSEISEENPFEGVDDLVKRLIDDGVNEVLVIDDFSTGKKENLIDSSKVNLIESKLENLDDIKNEKIDSIKSLLSEHNGTHNLSFHVYDDEEKIIVEMDSEKQKINITPKLLSDLEVKNIFYKLN